MGALNTNTASVADILRFWMAVDAPHDSDEHYVPSIRAVVFRTQYCAEQAGWHVWETSWQAGQGFDWRATGLNCWTETADPE